MMWFGDKEVFHHFVETVTRASTRRVVNRKSEGGSKLKISNSGELLLQHPLVLPHSLWWHCRVVFVIVAEVTVVVLCVRSKRAGFYWHVAVEMEFPLVPLPGWAHQGFTCRFTCRSGNYMAVILQPKCSFHVKAVAEVDPSVLPNTWLLSVSVPHPARARNVEFWRSLIRSVGVE